MKVWFKQTLHLHLADLLREWYQLLYEKKMYIINEINSLVFLANFFLSNLTLFFFFAYSLKTLILFYHLTKNQFVFNISVIYVVFFRRGGVFLMLYFSILIFMHPKVHYFISNVLFRKTNGLRSLASIVFFFTSNMDSWLIITYRGGNPFPENEVFH